MGLELQVERDFIKRLPAWLLPFKLNLQGNTGWPDRMILFIFPFIAFIEFKSPGSPLTGDRNQPERIAELRARGYPVLITDSSDEAYAFLESVSISTTGRSLNANSGLRGTFAATWDGENYHHIRSDPSSKA